MEQLPELSAEQDTILNLLKMHIDGGSWMTTVGGYAGVGKTTLLKHLRQWLLVERPQIRTVFASFTGKACSVLKRKGIPAQTLHSLLYVPIDQEDGSVSFALKDRQQVNVDLIINDEASMTNKELFDDIRYLVPNKAIFVGDHGQLPPVTTGAHQAFNLMAEPHLRLEKIHRQAVGSPIIALAHRLRTNKLPSAHSTDSLIVEERTPDSISALTHLLADGALDQLIVAANRRRISINHDIRKLKGFDPSSLPHPGERIIILNNSREHGLHNGQICSVIKIVPTRSKFFFDMIVLPDDTNDTIGPLTYLKSDLFTPKSTPYDRNAHFKSMMRASFAYAITCHKSQGSEWERVGVVHEHMPGTNAARWAYTATTRASTHLHYLAPVLDSRPTGK